MRGREHLRLDGSADLEKGDIKPWQHKQWCISKVDAKFVYHMEDVLDLYEEPYDPLYPTVCFDERSYQLLDDTLPPLPVEPGCPARVDYEYKRNGTCNLFAFFEPQFEPHRGWRHIKLTQQRTKLDVAECLRELVEQLYPHAKKIRVVLDNLNVHTLWTLYERYPAEHARRIASRLEFHHTPIHASWLNMVEIEFSALVRQCLSRRLPDINILSREIAAWESARNAAQVKTDWRFTARDARTTLARHYPMK